MWHVINENGNVIHRLQCSDQEAIANTPQGCRAYWCEARADWFEGDAPQWRPPAPSAFHVWDDVLHEYTADTEGARAARLAGVGGELNTRLYLPCNGFDADRLSRERISGMIARLQRGDGLPVGWMGWRDAENVMRWPDDDAETVLAGLTALARAIEDREQALLVASWQHKAAIAALQDVDALLAYDVAAGWPG